MSYRFMRVLVFFDLPVTDAEHRSAYTRFRKHLINSGFVMMQESVYTKIALNRTAVDAIMANLHKNKPADGLIQALCITEKQYARCEYILGEHHSNIIDTDERLVIL